jgi:hypothetical protein
VIEQWRKISPMAKLAALPLGLLFHRTVLPGKKIHLVRRAIRFLPMVMSAVRLFRAERR